MLAQRLRHRIAIQEWMITGQDPVTGAEVGEWVAYELSGKPLDNVPAEVLTGPGKEFIAADAKQAQTTARINIRWFPIDRIDLYRLRILWDGRVYNIVSAETDVTARREWRLRCEDGVNEG
ncbi:head-tail adaptor protein [Advenella mimigardefordensis]|uniref:Phage head-tail adaptor n=1 Tax=Advenella mimigardefordensis (strain DSM 17166 / LMG 22922 / DPN7) TaxID=1247726 RepID=W0P912_ADVMD|nr:head-tail adaptor protein [Advenella mimigardefordensis]AHG63186.1 hypothetical protein MIM_c10880 [Advenella mimigardefordensis DPN7]